jgi:hypothetical protein
MRKTKAQREEEGKLEEKRAKERERWQRRKLDKEYIARKQKKKAKWQKKNAKKNLQYVQDFYERYGISGREARALGKEGAASVSKGTTTKPSRPSRKRDTGGKVTRETESANESPKRDAVSKTRRRPRGSR